MAESVRISPWSRQETAKRRAIHLDLEVKENVSVFELRVTTSLSDALVSARKVHGWVDALPGCNPVTKTEEEAKAQVQKGCTNSPLVRVPLKKTSTRRRQLHKLLERTPSDAVDIKDSA